MRNRKSKYEINDEKGTKQWYNKEHLLHRTDGPAVEREDGGKEWWLNGKLHRTDGPAIETGNGETYWYLNDIQQCQVCEDLSEIDPDGTRRWYSKEHLLHREDGPAVEQSNGTKIWYLNGKQHREDGPAIETEKGTKIWYLSGKKHRMDGPACEWADGAKSWWLDGMYLSEEKFNQQVKTICQN